MANPKKPRALKVVSGTVQPSRGKRLANSS